MVRPDWQLPPGVTRGMWEYSQADRLAVEEDEYFATNQLFKFDQQVLQQYLTEPGLVADLGCGAGRALLPLIEQGFQGLAIELSFAMLQEVGRKASLKQLPVHRVQANLVQLDCFASEIVDYCICLYSTLGMVRGKESRQAVVDHAFRMLRPGGRFVIHVHNFWYNVFEPLSRGWALGNIVQSIYRRDVERGDRYYTYRGIPNVYLHVFTQSELTGMLKRAGFRIVRQIPVDTQRQAALSKPWFFGRFRANGWIVICDKA